MRIISKRRVRRVKRQVRRRDGYKCFDCGVSQEEHKFKYGIGLIVVEIVPYYDYEVRNCVTLCVSCSAK